jgi:hypothetical protein
LKNGTPLIINNKVQPANSPDPKPQEWIADELDWHIYP